MRVPFSDWDVDLLLSALKTGRFQLHFQPKVDLNTARIVGAEALVRHVDSTGRISFPVEFIAVFEQRGILGHLTRWACHETIEYLHSIHPNVPSRFRMSFNVAPTDLLGTDLFDSLQIALQGREFLALHLTLELTETSLLQVDSESLRRLSHLRDIGIGISMDDFGTGYSSIHRLRTVPFTELKIDREFVACIETSQACAKVVDATVAMAHYMNLTSVAEGIERTNQVHFLRNVGCEQGQGFFYAAPMPGEAFSASLDHIYNDVDIPVGFISQAVLDHLRWHRNLVCNLRQLHHAKKAGKQPKLYFPLSEFDPNECRLGHWMAHQRSLLENLTGYAALDEPHQAVHRLAENTWRKVVRGCSDQWLSTQLRKIGHISQKLVGLLYDLEYAVLSKET